MPAFRMPRRLQLVATLAVTQIIGWGTSFDMPAIIGPHITQSTGLTMPVVFAGLTVMMIIGGLAGPSVGRMLDRYGASKVLALGSLLFAIGLLMLSACQGLVGYALAWLVIGIAGALGLAAPAFAAVVEREGSNGKRTIALILIFTGLSASIFWPLTAWLVELFGWRQTLVGFAGLHLFVCLPLYLLGLAEPDRKLSANADHHQPPVDLSPSQKRLAFILLAVSTSVASFVSFGFSPTLLQLLEHAGATPALALQLGAARGVIAISARAVDFIIGKRGSAILTALVGTGSMLVSFAILLLLPGTPSVLVAFILFYSLGSGIMTVARAVLPLVIFSPQEFGRQSARLSLPQNVAIAAAPVVVATLLERFGPAAALIAAALLIAIAFAAVTALGRLAKAGAVRASLTRSLP